MRFLSVSILFLLLSPALSFTILGWQRKAKGSADDNRIDKNFGKLKPGAVKNVTIAFVPKQIKFTSFQKCKPCAKTESCVPAIQCPAHLKMTKQPQMCDLPGGSGTHGLCCSSKQNHTTSEFFKNRKTPRARSKGVMNEVIAEAEMEFRVAMHNEKHHRKAAEPQPTERHFLIQPDFFHHLIFGDHRPEESHKTTEIVDNGVEQMMASKVFKDKQHLTIEDSQLNNFEENFSGTPMEQTCLKQPNCPSEPSKYRTFDGSCNHAAGKDTWGAAMTPMERLLPPAYEDGIWSPRVHSVDGSKLQSARKISRTLYPDMDRPHAFLNLMVMQFGQFLSHDFTQSASMSQPNGERIKCCTNDGSAALPAKESHFACMPINIDEEDDFYRRFKQRCMNFVRLSIAPDHSCQLGYAKTLSKISHYIDGSAIYGSSDTAANELRSFSNGQLKMFIDFDRQLLPLNPNSNDCLIHGSACFMAGDVRVNQHITLVALHLMFAREHNRIANILHEINPHWSDEKLFQETRRIVVAEIQHITYNEWLPLIVGEQAMKRFSLAINPNGYSSDYDEQINPSMTNEFTGAAFRFGHSTVQGQLFVEFQQKLSEVLLVSDTFNNPSRFRFQHFYDEIMRTLVHQPMQEADNSVTFGLSRFLFNAGNPFGLDLVALNIQRGRDEALRPYNEYLAVGGRKLIEDFHEFPIEIAERLESVYNSPADIDLYVGGLMESSEDNAVVGPTFRDIIADQFSRLRRGDRYFYEHDPSINPGHFSPQQLQSIKKVTLARVICDNSDHIALVNQSPRAFIQSNLVGNEPIQCNSAELAGIDFSLWVEA